MTTWLSELTYGANERFFARDELDRVQAYYATVPARFRAAEELEKLEPKLAAACRAELPADAEPPSDALIRDQVESLRAVGQAMLLDDPRLLQDRLLDHLSRLTANVAGADRELRPGYAALDRVLRRDLSRPSFALVEPYLQRIHDALAGDAP